MYRLAAVPLGAYVWDNLAYDFSGACILGATGIGDGGRSRDLVLHTVVKELRLCGAGHVKRQSSTSSGYLGQSRIVGVPYRSGVVCAFLEQHACGAVLLHRDGILRGGAG